VTCFGMQASRFLLLDAKRKFEAHPSPAIPPNAYGQVRSQFALSITLYHAWSLLNTYGFRATKNYFSGTSPSVSRCHGPALPLLTNSAACVLCPVSQM
jgi:hypothetical protein